MENYLKAGENKPKICIPPLRQKSVSHSKLESTGKLVSGLKALGNRMAIPSSPGGSLQTGVPIPNWGSHSKLWFPLQIVVPPEPARDPHKHCSLQGPSQRYHTAKERYPHSNQI